MKSKFNNVLEMVGNTPVLKINNIDTGKCDLFVKMESLNPFGSIKDRVGLKMIQDAEAQGLIKEGSTIIESTAGNTGLGLALAAKLKGYKLILVIPDKMSEEKIRHLEAMGVEIIMTRSDVENGHPEHYQSIAEKLLKSTPNSFFANQFENKSNPQVHFETTGPEIWEQTDGKIDGFTCAIGTGGTLAGISMFLKDQNKLVKTAAADPMGAAMYSYIKTGELRAEGSSISEGIGQGRVTGNLDGAPFDDAYQITDEEALPIVFDLLKEEGLCLGASSGVNVAGAIRMAKEMGPGHTIVTILCDFGTKYQTKLFNPAFLREKNLPVPSWMEQR